MKYEKKKNNVINLHLRKIMTKYNVIKETLKTMRQIKTTDKSGSSFIIRTCFCIYIMLQKCLNVLKDL